MWSAFFFFGLTFSFDFLKLERCYHNWENLLNRAFCTEVLAAVHLEWILIFLIHAISYLVLNKQSSTWLVWGIHSVMALGRIPSAGPAFWAVEKQYFRCSSCIKSWMRKRSSVHCRGVVEPWISGLNDDHVLLQSYPNGEQGFFWWELCWYLEHPYWHNLEGNI